MCFMLQRKILAELRLILLSRVTAQTTAEGKTTHGAENSVVASNSHLPFHSSYTLTFLLYCQSLEMFSWASEKPCISPEYII